MSKKSINYVCQEWRYLGNLWNDANQPIGLCMTCDYSANLQGTCKSKICVLLAPRLASRSEFRTQTER